MRVTGSLPAIRCLIVAVALAAIVSVGGRGRSIHPVAAQSSGPPSIGPSAVFLLPGSALLDLGRQCPPFSPTVNVGSAACVAQAMQQGGASDDAVNFYLSTGHILTDFQGMGPIDVGTATYNLWCCTADTSDLQPVLLNGIPSVLYPLAETANLPLSSYDGYAAAVDQCPMLSSGGLDRIKLDQITASPEGGQRFIFDVDLINVCRACATGYVAQAALDFGPDGTYYGVVPLAILCEPRPLESGESGGESDGAPSPCAAGDASLSAPAK